VSKTGYFFAAFGLLGAVIQGALHPADRQRLSDKPTFMLGLGFGMLGLISAALAHSVALSRSRSSRWRSASLGHPTMSSLVSLVARGDEQGRVQGAASAVESLGRTIGPVWGNASLQQYGESAPYISARVSVVDLIVSVDFNVSDP